MNGGETKLSSTWSLDGALDVMLQLHEKVLDRKLENLPFAVGTENYRVSQKKYGLSSFLSF